MFYACVERKSISALCIQITCTRRCFDVLMFDMDLQLAIKHTAKLNQLKLKPKKKRKENEICDYVDAAAGTHFP